MVIPEGVMADLKTRAKAKRRNGLFKRGDTYWLRKRIRGVLYQVPLIVGPKGDAKDVYDQVLKEIVLGVHGMPQAPSLTATIEGWCRLHRKQEAHVKAARWAEGALGKLTALPLTSITTERLDEWTTGYQESHKPATVNLVLRYVKAWLRWAVRRKSIPTMPCEITMQRVEKRARPVVKIAQHDLFIQGVDCEESCKIHSRLADLQVRAAVRLMLGCGMRETEVLGARWEWLDAGQGEYTVGKAKGMKPRTIGVPSWALPWILALPRTVSGLIFPGPEGKPHGHNWLRKALARGARAAGVVGTVGNHRLRASFATRHAAAGTPTSDIQDMMGHESITTTQGYIEEDLGRQKSAQDRLSELLRKGS